MAKIHQRRRKQQMNLIILLSISVVVTVSGIYLLHLYSVYPPPHPPAYIGPYLMMTLGPALSLFVFFFEPVRVDVGREEIVFRTRWLEKRIRGFRVVRKFTTAELLYYVYFCPIGWRLDYWSLYAICSTAFGRATAFTTPSCSEQWIAVEAGGKKYVICCEEKDAEICTNL